MLLGHGRSIPEADGTARRARHARRSHPWLLAAVALGVIVVGLVAALALTAALGGDGADRPRAGADGPTDFVSYQDPQGRFGLSYPSDWRQVPPSAPDVALLLRVKPMAEDSMLVRVVPLAEPVKPDQLGEAKKITDRLVQGSDVRVLVERQVTLNGLPGYYYLYTFGEPGSDRFGLHAHYFLFSGSTMHVLVFQALPDTNFTELAPAFDSIARSYQVPSGTSSPAPATGSDPASEEPSG
jgi:hypothetical protein